MANFSVPGVKISAIVASAPGKTARNTEHPTIPLEDITKFIDTTGVYERRIAAPGECTSDLCFAAAERLFDATGTNRNDIDVLVFVSQTADYRLPVTSTILQHRLGLPKSCIAFDVPLGCSGYVYGLSVVAGMLKGCGLKKGLLLAGDTISKEVSPRDKSVEPLFGDAGSATLLETDTNCAPILFNLGSDGEGYPSIIIPAGGSRIAASAETMVDKAYDGGIFRNDCQLALEGMDVFSFGISHGPKTVNELMQHFSLTDEQVDHYIFHQANKMMNDRIVKKLKIAPAKAPQSLRHFGNTSSANIPLTIVTELDRAAAGNEAMVLCGFGVGLSWGTAYVQLNNCVIPELVNTDFHA